MADESVTSIKGSTFSFYTNHYLVFNKNIEKIIITIHGSTRNADTYFKSIWGQSKKAGVETSTLVISPHFKITGDSLKRSELSYSYQGWWIGDNSLKAKVSSFTVMDELVKKLDRNLFPNLKSVYITGHSAGGHFTQRYALSSKVELLYPGIQFKYIVANPGTYAYLTNKRPNLLYAGYSVPRNPGCPYNNYKWGLDNLNQYLSLDSKNNMIDRYIDRDVTYFLGENDTGDVEQTCQARLQGPNRFVRGVKFKGHIDYEYPNNTHKLITVPGVGHTQYGMYTSDNGVNLLFN
jgi:hypothetical protein